MPRVTLLGFRESDGSVPILGWLEDLPAGARTKCRIRLERLSELGFEIRRPEADYLRDGIYELRASFQGIHYRMLYFFLGRAAIVVTHGLVKERVVPPREIALAILRRSTVERDPKPSHGRGFLDMPGKRKPTRDLIEIIHRRFFEGRPERLAELEEARASAAIARQVYDLREKAGLSRRELARLVGTSQAAIRRLEEDDSEGHSLEMLQKIAHALGRRVDIRLLPMRRKRKTA